MGGILDITASFQNRQTEKKNAYGWKKRQNAANAGADSLQNERTDPVADGEIGQKLRQLVNPP